MTHANANEILTLDEVAAYPRVRKETVYRLARQGQKPNVKLSNTRPFYRAELHR